MIAAAKIATILGASAHGVEHLRESNVLTARAGGEVARWSLLEETLTNRTSLQGGEVEYACLESVSRSFLLGDSLPPQGFDPHSSLFSIPERTKKISLLSRVVLV